MPELLNAGGSYKNLGGPAFKDLDLLERLVNPHYWIWENLGGHGPPGPPVLPALLPKFIKPYDKKPGSEILKPEDTRTCGLDLK